LRFHFAAPIIVPSIGEAMSRHGGCRWISTRSLLRSGSGTGPAFMVPPGMETSACRQAHQFNRSRKMGSDPPWNQPTNDIVEAI
jgi:hypothetical protein